MSGNFQEGDVRQKEETHDEEQGKVNAPCRREALEKSLE